MTEETIEEHLASTRDLIRQMAVLLHGHNAEDQGAAIAEIVALWIVGHCPDIRDEVRANWLAFVDGLVPVLEQVVLMEAGAESWDDLPDAQQTH